MSGVRNTHTHTILFSPYKYHFLTFNELNLQENDTPTVLVSLFRLDDSVNKAFEF